MLYSEVNIIELIMHKKNYEEANSLKRKMLNIILFVGVLGSALTLVFSLLTQNIFVTNLVHTSSILVYIALALLVKNAKDLDRISNFVMAYYFYLLIGAYISTTMFSHITRIITVYVGVIIIVLFTGKMLKRLLLLESVIIFFMILHDLFSPTTYIKIERYLDATFEMQAYMNTVIASIALGIMILTVVAIYKKLLVDAQHELHIRSIKDPLTDAYNIRYFENQINKNLLWWKVDSLPFSIAIVDLDNFKFINDTYGHKVGDEVLRRVVKVINSEIHEEDDVYRYGGDEFIVVFPKMDVKSASKIMNSVVKRMNDEMIFEDVISLSVGVCDVREAKQHNVDILKLADDRMYFAKKYIKGSVRSVGGDIYE